MSLTQISEPAGGSFTPSTGRIDRDRWLTSISAVLGIISLTLFIILLFATIQNPIWQMFLLSATFATLFLTCAFIGTRLWAASTTIRGITLIGVVFLATMVVSTIVQDIGILVSLIVIIFTIIMASTAMANLYSDHITLAGLVVAMINALTGVLLPIDQVSFPALTLLTPVILAVIVMIYIVLIVIEFVSATIRIKLITVSLAIVLFPLILLSFIQSAFLQNAISAQNQQAFRLVGAQVARRVDDFINANLTQLENQAALPVYARYLQLPSNQRKNSPEEAEIRSIFTSLEAASTSYRPSFAILNSFGINIFDSNPLYQGNLEGNAPYFSEPVRTGRTYSSPVVFSYNAPYIYFSTPIRNERSQIIGVLRMRYDALILQSLMQDYVGIIGSRSYPVLLDENLIRIADTIRPNLLYRSMKTLDQNTAAQLTANKQVDPDFNLADLSSPQPDVVAAIENLTITPFFNTEFHSAGSKHTEAGIVVRTSTKPWYVLILQETTAQELISQNQQKLSTVIAAILAGMVGLITAFSSTVFSQPILDLANIARRVAGGDLSARAKIQSGDEVGELGTTFNSMTTQLSEFITELEARVEERTRELVKQNEALIFRSRQLQTVSDVARGVATAQALESLLLSVTQLISERFGFYHVGIFLIDERNEFAVLRAANSEGGRRMLARQHKLKVGQVGIVGYVTGKGQPRIATDVGEDAVFFNNPDLPLTRSEMALPLRAGNLVIGALDVQSTESNAFQPEDIELFTILADQVAIAIQNNLLYDETRRALDETQRLYRQYLQQEWASELAARRKTRFVYSQMGTAPSDQDVPEISRVIEYGQLYIDYREEENEVRSVLALPISLRGETIGAILMQESAAQKREWSSEEILAVQSIADQVAVALENARLFEQTVRRADRERKVLEITSKIRSTNDPQMMLQIAVEELQQSLKASRAQILLQIPEELSGAVENGNNGHLPEAEISTASADTDDGKTHDDEDIPSPDPDVNN